MGHFMYTIFKRQHNIRQIEKEFILGKPKHRTTPRRTGTRRSHLVVKLARSVNAKSPVKAYTTKRESSKRVAKAA
jgi:hypothetical protein